MPPGVQGLLDDEEMFRAPVTMEAAGQGVATGLDAMIFEGGELLGIALAGEDGFEDGQAGDAGEITDDIVDLEVHLGEGFLDVLDMAAGITGEGGPMPEEGAHGANLFGGPKAGAQQTDRVQILKPLAVTDVGFATGEIFAVAGIDQTDFQAGGFEDLEEGNPIDAGGFHGDSFDATFQQPIAQGVEIVGEGGEGADGFGIGVAGDSHLNGGGPDINPAGMRMEGGQLDVGFAGRFLFDFFTHRHNVFFLG